MFKLLQQKPLMRFEDKVAMIARAFNFRSMPMHTESGEEVFILKNNQSHHEDYVIGLDKEANLFFLERRNVIVGFYHEPTYDEFIAIKESNDLNKIVKRLALEIFKTVCEDIECREQSMLEQSGADYF